MARVDEADRLRAALPTGRTPQPWYDVLAHRQADLSKVDLFLLDEFGDLPPDHPARCERMLRADLIDRLHRPPHLHTFDVAATDLQTELTTYEAAVRSAPLDLVVLGLGANGHVALNEPGSTIHTVTRVVELAATTRTSAAGYADGSEAPTWGVTMGMATILSAREVWLLVTGAHKSWVLHRTLSAEIGPDLPATMVRNHPDATVFADEAAAGDLPD